jgi:hypothetical protein
LAQVIKPRTQIRGFQVGQNVDDLAVDGSRYARRRVDLVPGRGRLYVNERWSDVTFLTP